MSTQIRHFFFETIKKNILGETYILLIKEKETNGEESAFFSFPQKNKIKFLLCWNILDLCNELKGLRG